MMYHLDRSRVAPVVKPSTLHQESATLQPPTQPKLCALVVTQEIRKMAPVHSTIPASAPLTFQSEGGSASFQVYVEWAIVSIFAPTLARPIKIAKAIHHHSLSSDTIYTCRTIFIIYISVNVTIYRSIRPNWPRGNKSWVIKPRNARKVFQEPNTHYEWVAYADGRYFQLMNYSIDVWVDVIPTWHKHRPGFTRQILPRYPAREAQPMGKLGGGQTRNGEFFEPHFRG